jgi:hypothetical protein
VAAVAIREETFPELGGLVAIVELGTWPTRLTVSSIGCSSNTRSHQPPAEGSGRAQGASRRHGRSDPRPSARGPRRVPRPLEETSSLILHVVDASEADYRERMTDVVRILGELELPPFRASSCSTRRTFCAKRPGRADGALRPDPRLGYDRRKHGSAGRSRGRASQRETGSRSPSQLAQAGTAAILAGAFAG